MAEKANLTEDLVDFFSERDETCMDCPAIAPDWSSVSHGTLVCVACAGQHRTLGTHLSFVRSIHMDAFTGLEVEKLKKGGNQAMKEFFTNNGVDYRRMNITERSVSILQLWPSSFINHPFTRYNTKEAEKYRAKLEKLASG